MRDADKAEFTQVVRATFGNYSREIPLPDTLRMWWEMLAAFDVASVRQAFQRHIATEPKFPPTIGQILEILNAGNKVGKLGSEEAWAIAVKACDERETVMLTDQIAEAWGICKPIMDLGDEVGARMAFKEAYQRLNASSTGPVKWWPSIGNDPHKRDAALSEAKRLGLLPAPQVTALLPPAVRMGQDDLPPSPEGLRKLKELMASLRVRGANEAEEAEAERERKRQEETDRKAAITRKIADYENGSEQ
tara:strand:- start:4395 stop:5138 length:744 start_codon:yes stop_codon:yes gene_type:complete